jgi:hypothetical protein
VAPKIILGVQGRTTPDGKRAWELSQLDMEVVMKHMATLFATLSLIPGLALFGQNTDPNNCAIYNNYYGPFTHYVPDSRQHITENHWWVNSTHGTCEYSGEAPTYGPIPCGVHATASSASIVSETGMTGFYWHQPNIKDAQGISDGPAGGSAMADSEGAVGVNSCTFLPCGMNIEISGEGKGFGFTVSYSPPSVPFFNDAVHYPNNACSSRMMPPWHVCTPTGPPPYTLYLPQYWIWDTSTCKYKVGTNESPIVIDTKSKGFRFSNPAKGDYAVFDLHGDGTAVKLSWPTTGTGNMWLVLPDENGQVSNGKQLFGNYTPHSDGDVKNHPNPNGFLALAWYDGPSQGGDGNLILDAKDSIWSKLRLWDASFCLQDHRDPCVSKPNELHTLESAGIYSVSLVWDSLDKVPLGTVAALRQDGSVVYGNLGGPTDLVGNQYKYKSVLNPEAEDTPIDDKGQSCCDLHKKSRTAGLAVDVYLISAP